jgi:predicted membrane protein (TIGR00267 family)
MNSYDGAMTMLGIILGAHAGGLPDPRIVIGAGLGASFAMGVSGFSGAFETERAERMRRLHGLRRAMLTDLRRSFHLKAGMAASVWAAVVDGLSPALAAAVPMTPYALAFLGILSTQMALYVAVILILVLLFILGAFLGRISKANFIFGGLRMLLVGAVTAVILLLVGGLPH